MAPEDTSSTTNQQQNNPDTEVTSPEEDDHTGELDELLEEPDLDDFTPPLPPDGGYGWVIAVTSFMINLMVDGMCYMGGVLYIELLDYFQDTKSKTQWVHTLVPAVYLATGPFVGALVNKYGAREITICGSLLATVFFVISSFAPNIEMLIFTYGIMIGIGFGLMYLPAVCFVSYYFDRKRALATGIAVCGSGIGTFVFPPLMNIFLNTYGWRGSMLLLAGLTLNCCVFGAMLRPLRVTRPKPRRNIDTRTKKEKEKEKKMAKELAKQKSIIMQKIVEQKNRQRTISTGSLDGTVITTDNTLVKDPQLLRLILQNETVNKSPQNLNCSVPDLSDKSRDLEIRNEDVPTSMSQPSSPKSSRRAPQQSPSIINKHLDKVKGLNGSQVRLRQTSECSTATARELDSTASKASLERRRKDMNRIMYRQDIFYTGSVTSIAEYRSNPDMTQYVQSVVSIPESTKSERGRCAPCTNILGQMFDMSLFKSVTFVILMSNAFFSFMGFFVPFMFVPDLATIQGASVNRAAFLISILGICNTVGRVAAGWLADRPWADCLVIQNVALIVGGVSTLLVPLYVNYALLAIYSAIFGTCMAMFIALRSIVTAEMLGIQKLNNAFGLTIFFQGIAGIAGSPLAGTIFDATGSYAVSFVIAGIFITFSGLICLPLRRIARWENSKTNSVIEHDDIEITMDDLPFPSKNELESNNVKEVSFLENQTNSTTQHSPLGV